MAIRVAFDMTPTLGTRTGIGNVVTHLYESISDESAIELVPYTLSYKARSFADELPDNNIFIKYPARILLAAWKYSNLFSLDKAMEEIDVWHATNYLAPPTNNPLLITIHDVTMVKYPDLVPAQVRSLAPMISRRLRAGAHVQVPAHAIKEDVLEHFGSDIEDTSHIHVIPFSVPDLVESPPSSRVQKLSEGDPYILCIGALEPRKNHARLIDAFEIIHASNPHVRLFLVGPDGPARPAIDAALARLSHNARSRVVITGSVSDADRTWLLHHAHLVAYPSLYEGFGLPLLEAMTAHAPIVTTREGSLEEIAASAAHYVDAHDSNDIARGILEVLESQETRDRLIAAGNNRINDFSWAQSARMLTDTYIAIAKKN
ncbi:MAG TPA: glycosyltransferase family 1 protein [Acidimicrobiia bacterium]|nr:glycosyltransferase family 1 protein [Acidimicrobiia bacterium]